MLELDSRQSWPFLLLLLVKVSEYKLQAAHGHCIKLLFAKKIVSSPSP